MPPPPGHPRRWMGESSRRQGRRRIRRAPYHQDLRRAPRSMCVPPTPSLIASAMARRAPRSFRHHDHRRLACPFPRPRALASPLMPATLVAPAVARSPPAARATSPSPGRLRQWMGENSRRQGHRRLTCPLSRLHAPASLPVPAITRSPRKICPRRSRRGARHASSIMSRSIATLHLSLPPPPPQPASASPCGATALFPP